ncbi:MAG TPA: hypothetical protein PK920_04990, partial [Phycisphaerae bacterium]|nr:hypothetical protein [Phycisphaerae bacterium]
MKLRTPTFRRGTLLLMVVGLLASLFMIISTFLTLARSDNRRAQITQHADQTQEILRTAEQVILSAIRQAWADGHGNLLTGGWKNPDLTGGSDVLPSYAPTNILGAGGTSWLGGAEVVRDHSAQIHMLVPPGTVDELSLMRVHRQIVSSLDGTRAAGPSGVPTHKLWPRQYP